MSKRILKMFLLLALAFGLYAMTAKANGGGEVPTATAQPTRTPTQTPTVCNVQTGIEGGAVNLRTCAGVSCAVLGIVAEGERLTILTAGNWTHVTNADGVTGWLNSKYCVRIKP
ncbi:MAG: SH3 domain-containing protein [Anaerolineales bacterium]|nr:SH3 domain-containing protein [Anaerolineales bacterium]